MEWLTTMVEGRGSVGAVAVLCMVVGVGLAVGAVRVRGVSLGVAGVLFAGLAVGQAGVAVEPAVLQFVRDVGLVVFVFMIGLQVGPGFLSAWRRDGLRLNLLTVGTVLLGAGLVVGMTKFLGVPVPTAIGLYAGGNTSTPSLAAGQEALRLGAGAEAAARAAAVGYAIAYPVGVLGPMAALVLVRVLLRIDVERERQALVESGASMAMEAETLKVAEEDAVGRPLDEVLGRVDGGVVVSRLMRDQIVTVPEANTLLRAGDLILAVGPHPKLRQLQALVGPTADLDLRHAPGEIVSKRVFVTQRRVAGRRLEDLDLDGRYGVTLTRIGRSGVEITPSPRLTLNFGDAVLVVGTAAQVRRVAEELGNSAPALETPRLAPIAVGILCGVVVGSIPLAIPGLPAGVRLGLAVGPMLVAIVVANLGRLGPLIWYVPGSANMFVREGAISLFFAAVGLQAGPAFAQTLAGPGGLLWAGLGATLTLMTVGALVLAARLALGVNYVMLCGLVAGTFTQPAVLALATRMTRSEMPAVAYAAVYPTSMLLRVVLVQIMVMLLAAG